MNRLLSGFKNKHYHLDSFCMLKLSTQMHSGIARAEALEAATLSSQLLH